MFVLVFACSVTPLNGSAQQPHESVAPKDTKTLRVYSLRYVDTSTVYDVASTVLRERISNLSMDKRSNSVIVNAPAEGHQAMTKLIETLDVAPKQLEEIKILRSDHVDADTLAILLPNLQIATSGQGVILKGAAEELRIAEALALRMTESAEAAAQPTGLIVEVQWLTEGEAAKGRQLKGELVEKLSARGFSPLSVTATLETRVSPQGEFASESIQGVSMLKVEGKLNTVDNQLEVALETSASRQPVVLEFESIFLTKPDQWLVFGVAQGSGSDQENATRSLILVRVKQDLPL
ncbi:MAG: secretin N-terminal domain-containing protein [Planctomycetota bacterium]